MLKIKFLLPGILGVPEGDGPKFGRWTKAFIAIGGGGNPLRPVTTRM